MWPSFFPKKCYIRHVSTQHRFSFVLFFLPPWHWRHCGARIWFQSFPQHHPKIKGNRADVVGWTVVCFGWISSSDPPMRKKKKSYYIYIYIYIKWPTRQTVCQMRSHGKTKAISYWCHHLVQSGWNSISLSLYIYSARPCNKAVLHQFSAMCRFAVACRGDDRPSFSFLWPVWITWLKKKKNFHRTIRTGWEDFSLV